jgi:hypothetical protein
LKEEFETYLNKAVTDSEVYTFQKLKAIYEEWNEKPVSESAFRVTLHRLKKRGLLKSVRRGLYKVDTHRGFELVAGEDEKAIFEKIKSHLPLLDIALWNSSIFDSFASFQSANEFIYVEVESGSEESVFQLLQDLYPDNLFLKPDEEIYSNYIAKTEKPIIIKTLISESPLETADGIPHPSVEKIIVDLYADELHFRPWIGERERIVTELFGVTVINLSTLLRYASRRNRKEFIKSFILDRELVKPELLEGL